LFSFLFITVNGCPYDIARLLEKEKREIGILLKPDMKNINIACK